MGTREAVLWSMAVLAGALALAGLAEAGAFDSMMVPGLMTRIQKRDNSFHSGMTEDDLFAKFFPDTSYLLKPEEHYKEERASEEDFEEDETIARGLIQESYEEYDSSEEEDDEDNETDVASRSVTDVAFKFLKAFGKIGWTMLKKGISFLKSVFYKFGGKRLLKRAKDYLKNDMFTIDPLDCKDGECASCAVFTLPFKIKEFKACAKMGVDRKDKQTNFTMKFDVHKHVLFQKDIRVGDVSNCFGYEVDPKGEEYGLAAMIGKVCVQGFEFKVDKKEAKKPEGAPAKKRLGSIFKKTQVKKFCLALVFKRWATGYRFCAQRVKPKDKKDKEDKKDDDDGEEDEHEVEKRAVAPVKKNSDKMSSQKVAEGKDKKKWKFSLKRIAAGEQEDQIVADKPLFKNEEEVRKNNSARALKVIAEEEAKQKA